MQLIQLGELVLNEHLSVIMIDGQEVSLDPKMLDLLMLFCQKSEQLIGRQEILDTVWAGSIVTDNAVNKLVASLRKILGDDSKNPKYIQTVPKRGYRLICAVSFKPFEPAKPQATNLVDTSTPKTVKPDQLPSKSKQYVVAALLFIVLVGFALFFMPTRSIETGVPSKNTQELTRIPGIEHSALMSDEQDYIVFLSQDQQTGAQQLWRKNLISNNEYRIVDVLPNISRLISLTASNETSQLIYLAQGKRGCVVIRANWLNDKKLAEPEVIFDCSSFVISDITWLAKKSQLIFSASAQGESTNHIYRFDLTSQTQQLLTQPDITGVGNSGLDISPDGKKLLIVNIDKAYHSQLFVLDLLTNELTPSLRVNYNISEATWYHDSKRVLYFGAAPSHQILLSDLAGKQQHALLNASDYLKNEFTRIKSSQDILFSTANSNYNNRWLKQSASLKKISNSTVFDTSPALAHQTPNYAFVSSRSGQDQLYYGNLLTGESSIISQLDEHQVFTSLAFSPDDNNLLLTGYSTLWILSVEQLLQGDIPLKSSANEASFQANGALHQIRWLTNDLLYFVVNSNNKTKHYLFNKTNNQQFELSDRWSTLVTDHNQTNRLYLLDKDDNQLYQMPIEQLNFDGQSNQVRISKQQLKPTKIYIPADYWALKIHNEKLHYIIATDEINLFPNSYELHIQSLVAKDKSGSIEVFELSCSCGFDVSDLGLIVSERISFEGDIHRTLN